MVKVVLSFLLGALLTLAVTAWASGPLQTPNPLKEKPVSPPLTRPVPVPVLRAIPPRAEPVEPTGGPEYEEGYAWQVLNLINIAAEIRRGHALQLADRIEGSLPNYLRTMEPFTKSPAKVAAFYSTGVLYRNSRAPLPTDLRLLIIQSRVDATQILSKDCFKEIICIPGKGCHAWPTSLNPVDVNVKDPMGWHYIQGSHCGFSWPKFWVLSCGQPLGLEACSGDKEELPEVSLPAHALHQAALRQ